MIGPHYQRLAEVQRNMSSKQMMERMQARTDNPLLNVIDKLKREFSSYDTVYTEDIIDHPITSVDRLLSFDGKLGPILGALQKQNNLLRKQLSLIETQLSNTLGICEQVIAQNNQLKTMMQQKNNDIQKILETIAHNQSQTVSQLEQKVLILQQENSILIQHLDEVKQKHEDYILEFKSKDEEIVNWQHRWNQVKNNLTAVFDRERELSRKLAISQQFLFEEKQKNEKSQHKIANSMLEVDQLKRKLKVNENSQSEINLQRMRKQIQNQYAQILKQHKNMKKQRSDLLRDVQRTKMQKQKIQDLLMDMQRKFNKVLNEYELTTSLQNEQKQKNQTLVTTLKKLQNKIDELKAQNLQLKMEVESSKSYAMISEKNLREQVQSLRTQLHEKSVQMEKKLKQIRMKTQQLMDTKQIEIKSLNDTNNELRRLLDGRG